MVTKNVIYVWDSFQRITEIPVSGKIVTLDNEEYYRIKNYDRMLPFLMNIVSDSDLWMFISSNGALTAGRRNPDNALFPYYTDDRIHDSHDITGSKTVLLITKNNKLFLWEPFSSKYEGLYNTERIIYKNIVGNKLIFEEVNHDLEVSFRYSWMNCDKYGFIKKSEILNNSDVTVSINILDGLQNILPFGVDRKFQLEYSTLLDGYKKNELLEDSGLALFTLSSIPTDRAEPNESLRATTVWSAGLSNSKILLSNRQLNSFERGNYPVQETSVNGERGAFFLQAEFELQQGKSEEWYIVADLNKDQSDVALLSSQLLSEDNLIEKLEDEILNDTTNLKFKVANADGIQLTNDHLNSFRHFSNVTFNIMRGGIFDNNCLVDKSDFCLFVQAANINVWEKNKTLLLGLPDRLNITELRIETEKPGDLTLQKLCYEYLPLTFSRRHGDPSRPWNLFSIDVKDENGKKVLNYQGNWRDIFQNWEALGHSFPCYIENMITKFVNASTADGYNPYRVTREGFDWEVLDLSDTWSYIGYWGDHQIVYLLKLLELSDKYHPGVLKTFLTRKIFTYANVPYKLKSYREVIKDPHHTIDFDHELNEEIKIRVGKIGADGKLIEDKSGGIYKVNLAEKLLVPFLVKLSNFIPEAGIWMNTQRPEWNDANNALVGFGASMVTLYHLRRFITFSLNLFNDTGVDEVFVSEEVQKLFADINKTFVSFKYLLKGKITDIERKQIVDALGEAGSMHRLKIYSDGFSGKQESIGLSELLDFYKLALEYIDHSISANKRSDELYHSYNLIKIESDESISVRFLSEMLEGQAAILGSGFLSIEESITLLNSLKQSKLYRSDQYSYLLYPERQLSRFTEKNIVPKDLVNKSRYLKEILNNKNGDVIVADINNTIHFNSKFRNVSVLNETLREENNSQNITAEEQQLILNIYEEVFHHQSFTGRSGTFYKYEGLGCIYWHMVSKLLLSVQETFYKAIETGEKQDSIGRLNEIYYEIKEGIGCHKQPDLYGAFPTDAYSHTPKNIGAQQPGMTGQVKEDIISRLGELGLAVSEGEIRFNVSLLNDDEFINKSQVFNYYDVLGNQQSLMINPGMLAFTCCQVPVIYIISDENKIVITRSDNTEEEFKGLHLNSDLSSKIFQRDGSISKIKVMLKKDYNNK